MNSLSVVYNYKWELDFAPEYKFTIEKSCINIKTGRRIKKTMIGYTVGYYIRGKFYSLTALRKHLVKEEKYKLPF
jgi:hypothetical protein